MTLKDTITATSGGKTLEAKGPAVYMTMMVFVVLSFLVHLERMSDKESEAQKHMDQAHGVVSKMRIDQCHAIQEEALGVIKANTASSLLLAETLGDWKTALARIEVSTTDNTRSLHELLLMMRNPQKRSTYVE